MQSILNFTIGVYVTMGILSFIGVFLTALIHASLKRIEGWVSEHVASTSANKINDLLNVIDSLAESAVQDANSRIVVSLKANQLFTKQTAVSVKQAVVQDVIKQLGTLGSDTAQLIGPLEQIVSQKVEKQVFTAKDTVNRLVPLEMEKTNSLKTMNSSG